MPIEAKTLTVVDFIEWLTDWLEDREYAEEYVENVYLKDPDGCLPEDYIGDQLLDSIHQKFWYPIRWIVERACLRGEPPVQVHDVGILIDASYEDASQVLVFLSDRVLFYDSWKAWRFWWPSDEGFERWANETLATIVSRLKPSVSSAVPDQR